MPAVALIIPSSLGLDYEHIHCKQEEWNPVDSMETSWRLRLCWWCRIALTHPTSNAGKYHYHQSKFCPHSTGYSFIQWRVRFSRPIQNTTPVVLGDRPLVEVESFTYLGSNVDKQGGTDADIRIRMGKARTTFHQLRKVWRCTILSTKTKLPIFNSIFKPVLLYGAETWRTTVANTKKLQTFLMSQEGR